MATTNNYRYGPIQTLQAGSGETLGSGGALLNNNFTQLYDMVCPLYRRDWGHLADVPTVYDGSTANIVRTFALPDASIFNGTTSYVATYNGSNVTWQPYTTGGSGGTGGGGANAEELTFATTPVTRYSVPNASYTGEIQSYQKTYTKSSEGNSVYVELPTFGIWMVNGVIASIRGNGSSSYGNARVVRVVVCGRDTSIKMRSREMYTSNSTWTSCDYPNIYISNGRLYFDDISSVQCITYDLTLSGGADAPVATSGSFELSMTDTSGSDYYGGGSSNGYGGSDNYGGSSNYYYSSSGS